jgi:hypothetical protein
VVQDEGRSRIESDLPHSTSYGISRDALPTAAGEALRRGGYSSQTPDRDDRPTDARKGAANEDYERDQRRTASRDVPANFADRNSTAEGRVDNQGANRQGARPVLVAVPAQPGNGAQPADNASAVSGPAADRLGPLSAGRGPVDDGPSPVPALAPGSDSGAAARPEAQAPPEAAGGAAPAAPAATGTPPLGEWLTVDLAALERGVESLLTRLDLLGRDEPRGMTIACVSLHLAGAWAAYELVRARRRNPGLRPAWADAAPGWGGGRPLPEDEA